MPRCRECTYVLDEDEWICAVCGELAPVRLARLLSRALRAIRGDPESLEVEDDADFDADELGLETEPD